MRLEFSIEIFRPRKDVFAVVSHLENDPRWQKAVKQSSRLTSGPTQVGTRFRQAVDLLGRRMRVDLEFAEFTPDEGYLLRCECGPLVFDTQVCFTPTRRGTQLTVLVAGRPTGIARIVATTLSRRRSAEIEADLGNLKGLLEAGSL